MLAAVIQAILFDAAGTLIRPSEPVAATYARLLSPHLGTLDPAELDASFGQAFRNAGIPDYHGQQDGDLAERTWWRNVVESTVGQEVSDAAFHALFDHYAAGTAWRAYPEVIPALQRARDAGFRCAVVSNFDLRLHPILEQLGLIRFFDLVLTSAEARARKPSPQIFNQALSRLGLRAEQVLHVGDCEIADIDGAVSVAIGAHLVRRPENDLLRIIDRVCPRPGN